MNIITGNFSGGVSGTALLSSSNSRVQLGAFNGTPDQVNIELNVMIYNKVYSVKFFGSKDATVVRLWATKAE